MSFRFVFTRLVWLPLADAALLHAACCQVRLKRTFDWFVGGSDRERETEGEREGQLHLAFWWKKDVFLVSVIFLVAFVAFVVVLFPQSPLPACESENATKCSEL